MLLWAMGPHFDYCGPLAHITTTTTTTQAMYRNNVNSDKFFMLRYDKKSDERNNRPLMYTITVALPMDGKTSKDTIGFWKDAPFVDQQVAETAKCVKLSEMVWPNRSSASDASLPDTTEVDQTFHADKTYAQLGGDASGKILDMVIDWKVSEAMETQKKHLFLVDLNVNSSVDFANAMMMRQPLTNMTYVALAETDETAEFVKSWMISNMVELIKNKTIKTSGFEMLPEEMPAEERTGLPPKPQLNFLTLSRSKHSFSGMQLETLQLPQKFLELYHDHPTFSTEFREWYKQSQETVLLDRNSKDKENGGFETKFRDKNGGLETRFRERDGPGGTVKEPGTPTSPEEGDKKRQKACLVKPLGDLPVAIVHEVTALTTYPSATPFRTHAGACARARVSRARARVCGPARFPQWTCAFVRVHAPARAWRVRGLTRAFHLNAIWAYFALRVLIECSRIEPTLPSLPYAALRSPTLPMLPFAALRCPTLPYAALRCPTLPYAAYAALRCPMLPYAAYAALRCPMRPYAALRCPTLPRLSSKNP